MKSNLVNDWKEVKLWEICKENSGTYGINESAVEYNPKLYRYLRITDIKDDGTIDESKKVSVNINKDEESKYLLHKNDIVFARTGASAGRSYFYTGKEDSMIFAGFLIKFPLDESKVIPEYIKYYCQSAKYKDWVKAISTGSTRPNINAKMYANMVIDLPPIEQQRLLVDTLSALENKIELNNKINENLEQQAQAIFKHWFIDFEFPDENGNPNKSSGGEMIESELGMIPKGWSVSQLDKIIELHDSKRIPLSKRERDSMANDYPYYGATSIIDYVENYIFDGTYLLLGEDGSVSDGLGYPILQYVWGKFWVNNHAHVITGKDYITVEYLYMLFKNTNVNNIITGAVQKKINQRNLNSLKIINPKRQIILDYIKIIEPIFKSRKSLEIQSAKLSKLRDTLLPKLMSGEIRIPLD